jgi:hypothetical protein
MNVYIIDNAIRSNALVKANNKGQALNKFASMLGHKNYSAMMKKDRYYKADAELLYKEH